MKIRLGQTLLYLLVTSLFLSACGIDVETEVNLLVWDPDQTQILVNSSVEANGVDQAKLRLKVVAETGDFMLGLKLRAQAAVANVVFLGCSPSTFAGISDCYFTSTVPGEKEFVVTDGRKTKTVIITFVTPKASNQLTKVTFSESKKQIESGYKIQTHVHYNQYRVQEESGYTIETHISPSN